jgi:hypothetical protein
MSQIPPGVAPSSRSWLGIAREIGGNGLSGAGTPVLPTNTIPLDKSSYEIEDMPHFLEDLAIRGSMSHRFADVLGVEDASFSFGGPFYGDVWGFFLDNIFGDLSTTGTSPANGTHITNSGGVVAGGTSITVPSTAGYTNSSVVQIDSGAISEVVVLNASGGTAATTLYFSNYPLRFAHGSAATVVTVSGQYDHTFAVLNQLAGYGGAAGAQGPTHTVTDVTYLTPSVYGRSYPSLVIGTLEFTGNSENLLMAKATGNTWVSAPASTIPTNSTTFTVPLPNWRTTITIGTVPIYDIGDYSVSIKREMAVYWTEQGAQNPFIIARGDLDATGSIKFTVPSDETALNYMLNNTQPSVTIVATNGQTLTNELQLTLNMNVAAFIKAKPTRSGVLIGYDTEFRTEANTTSVGGSGGLGQITAGLINNTATY